MSTGLRIPLWQSLPIRAALGQERVWEPGVVPVNGQNPQGAMVIVHIEETEGRGRIKTGLRWPDMAEPIWADEEKRLEPCAFAIPILPDADGCDQSVTVLLALQPLGPLGLCNAIVSVYLQLPPREG